MKRCLVSLLLTTSQLIAQPSPFEDVKLEQGKLYMVARGTRSKQGFISKNFNSVDSNITHIGLAFYEPLIGGLKIYNVTTEKKKRNALWVETIQEFSAPKDIFYLGLWSAPLSQKQVVKIRQMLAAWEKRTVTFDYDFDLKNADSTLYCSEFCWKVLAAIDERAFAFRPVTRALPNAFYRNMFGSDTLNYIPVDFFISFPRLRKVTDILITRP